MRLFLVILMLAGAFFLSAALSIALFAGMVHALVWVGVTWDGAIGPAAPVAVLLFIGCLVAVLAPAVKWFGGDR